MLNYVRGLYPLGRGNVGCCCIFGSEVKLRFYFWCYVYVQYMTQKNSVIIVPDGAVDNTVVCEETSRTVHRHTREVVYVQEEQGRSQNGALGDTIDNRFLVR